jgi:hypothetical protein
MECQINMAGIGDPPMAMVHHLQLDSGDSDHLEEVPRHGRLRVDVGTMMVTEMKAS